MPNLTPDERLLMRSKLAFDVTSPDVTHVIVNLVTRMVHHVMKACKVSPDSPHDEITAAVVEMNKILRAELDQFGVVVKMKVASRDGCDSSLIVMELYRP